MPLVKNICVQLNVFVSRHFILKYPENVIYIKNGNKYLPHSSLYNTVLIGYI